MRFTTLTVFALCAYCRLAVAAPALPADPRLDPVRARIGAVIARAEQAGLPAEVIVSKVREGLAKGVEPQRIEAAAQRLADSLTEARAFLLERRRTGGPAPELVRALAEARIAGIELSATAALVNEGRAATESARAVEVLTDLSLRGYPLARASQVVGDVLARDPGAMPRVPTALETIRIEQALTQSESMDALAQGMSKGGGSLQAAAAHAAAAERRAGGPGRSAGKGNAGGNGPGNSGFVPPGQLKKETGAAGKGKAENPGQSMGHGQGRAK